MSRIRTPTRIQMEAAECGAVALGMALAYFGRNVSTESLREACGVSRDGCSAGQVARAARAYGMVARGLKAELDALTQISVPAILHWEFDHFVVLEGVRKGRYYVNDPAVGPRVLTYAEMDAAFTGVAIELKPGPQFEKSPHKSSIAGRLWKQLRPVRPALWLALAGSMAMLLPNLLIPSFSGVFADQILIKGHNDWLWGLLASMLVTLAVRAWSSWQSQKLLLRAQTMMSASGALAYLRHALTLPVNFFYHRYAAEIASRLSLHDALSATMVQTIVEAAFGFVAMVVFACIMFHYDVALTWLALAFAAMGVLSLYVSQRLLDDQHRRVLVEEARLNGIVSRTLATLEESTAAGTSNQVFARLAGQQAAVLSRRQAVERNGAVLQAVQRCLSVLALIAVLIKGGYDIMQGAVTIGMMLSFQGLMYLFGMPVAQLLNAGSALQDVRGNLERLDDVLQQPSDPVFAIRDNASAPVPEASNPAGARVQFDAVTFAYGNSQPVLMDLTLDVAPGTAVAIVGASGCGKSTLARLLVGQLQAQSGEILLDGVPLDHLSRTRRCDTVACVEQDVRLLSGSIRENLTLWDETIPDANLVSAAQCAVIDDTIAARPGALLAPVTQAGANFSGGERQRLDIARALARDCPVLVLDEATSALDPQAERILLERIMQRHKTLILISHRIAPLDLLDRIVVLDQGRIVQDGSFAQLVGQDGPLRELIDA